MDRGPLRASVIEVHKMWLTRGSCWQHDASMRGRDSSVLSPWQALSRNSYFTMIEVQSLLRRASWASGMSTHVCFKCLCALKHSRQTLGLICFPSFGLTWWLFKTPQTVKHRMTMEPSDCSAGCGPKMQVYSSDFHWWVTAGHEWGGLSSTLCPFS